MFIGFEYMTYIMKKFNLTLCVGLILIFLFGCTNNSINELPCAGNKIAPFGLIKIAYDNSKYGEHDVTSIIIEVPKKLENKSLQEVTLTKNQRPYLVVPINEYVFNKNDKSASFIFFANDQFLNGDYCVSVTYIEHSKTTNSIVDYYGIFDVLKKPKELISNSTEINGVRLNLP